MLKLIRNNVQSFGVKFIVGIVTVVMLGFGITTYTSQDINTLVSIDDYEIKLETYQRALRRAEQSIRAQYQDQAAEYIKMINLKRQILSQLTSNVLLFKSAEENGLTVTDKELAQTIYTDPSFITDGRFDKEKYENTLRNSQINKLTYEQDFRENLTVKKLFRFLNSDQLVSRKSLAKEYKRFNSEMEIQAIEVSSETFSASLKLLDKDSEEYYAAHKNDFMQTPKIVANYFILDPDDIKSKTVVREKETRHYYQKNQKEFTRKESFLLKQILIAVPEDNNAKEMDAAKQKAENISKTLLKNKNKFAALSKKYSSDFLSAEKGGNLGWLEKGTFPLTEEIEEVIEKLDKNEISEPFLTAQGYHIIELLDKKPAYVLSLEEVKAEIENKIKIKKAKRRLKNQIVKLSQNINSQSLSEIAESLGKKVIKSPSFDENGNVAPNLQSPQLYYFLKLKQEKDKGHFNQPDSDKVIVYEIDTITKPSPKPLKEVKDEVAFLARKEKLSKITKEKIKKYSAEIKNLEQFNKLSSELGIKPSQIKLKLSDLEVPSINAGRSFKVEVFKMKPKQFKVISENDRHFLVYLINKQESQITDEDMERLEALKLQIKQQKAQMLLYAIINETEKKVDIQYNNSILEALDIK